MTEDVFVPFESTRPVMATEVRTTLICSSIQAMRSRQLYEAYFAALPDEYKPQIEAVVPAQWAPISLALAHYKAVDALDIDSEQRIDLGADVGRRTNQSLVSVVGKLSRGAGITPWMPLSLVHKLRDITWHGSDLGVWKLGPKDARVVWIAQPCAASTQFCYGFAGFLRTLLELFCQKAYVRLLAGKRTATSFERRASWA